MTLIKGPITHVAVFLVACQVAVDSRTATTEQLCARHCAGSLYVHLLVDSSDSTYEVVELLSHFTSRGTCPRSHNQ